MGSAGELLSPVQALTPVQHVEQYVRGSIFQQHTSDFVKSLAETYKQGDALGTMTCSVYDTAWASMLTMLRDDGVVDWLFPDSFDWLLSRQTISGGWQAYAAPIDAILNTMAALLAVCKRLKQASNRGGGRTEIRVLEQSKQAAISFLQTELHTWSITDTSHVGFEILVPAHLDMLESEGVSFDFPQRRLLLSIRDVKFSRFDIDMLYGKRSSSMLHCLEALIGKIDFDRLRHHLKWGSMMASPASTAAYLMNVSTWDIEAETYLRRVVMYGNGQGEGGVSSAFPTATFEISWAMSTLLDAGCDPEMFQNGPSHTLQAALEKSLKQNHGTVGFAPGVASDADDTSAAITALNLSGAPYGAYELVAQFEALDHFRTYDAERNASFTTNCNVLTALLVVPDGINLHNDQIHKTLDFIINCWWQSKDPLEDKWNLSPLYAIMQMSKALTNYVLKVPMSSHDAPHNTTSKISLVLVQALSYILRTQHYNGSWGENNGREETSYAIIALKAITSMPFVQHLRNEILTALERGINLLRQEPDTESATEYLWTEKVTYSSTTLSQAYTLAALHKGAWSSQNGTKPATLPTRNTAESTKLLRLWGHLPILAPLPKYRLKISMLEGELFAAMLKQQMPSIFPRKDMRKETYLSFIPLTWTAANALSDTALSSEELLDMMVLSALIYQVDEFMETGVIQLGEDERIKFSKSIDILLDVDATGSISNGLQNGYGEAHEGSEKSQPNVSESRSSSMTCNEMISVLQKAVPYFIGHPHVMNAPAALQRQMRSDLKAFLHGHLKQVQSNSYLRNQDFEKVDEYFASFFNWIRTTSADHTRGPFAMTTFLCFLSGRKDNTLSDHNVEHAYILQDISRHSASMCRMYNDWGSVSRDAEEFNVNSLDFEEFRHDAKPHPQNGVSPNSPKTSSVVDTSAKDRLMHIAEYERSALDHAMEALKRISSPQLYSAIKMFCDVTDIYGQLYVVKDMTPKLQKRK